MTIKSPGRLIMIMIISICSLPFLSKAQTKTFDYSSAWKKVDSLRDKQLPKSGLTQVNLIYTRAREEKNEPQTLKALIYRIDLQTDAEDDDGAKAFAIIEKEISVAAQPARSILQSIAAGMYWSYFQQHRYKLYNRTATTDVRKDDITTWGYEDFHKKIDGLFMASLQDEKLLTATRLDSYDAIIRKGNVRALRPTLFDLLAHQALDYFESNEVYITQPAYIFQIEDPAAFADAAIFAKHRFSTSDSASIHYRALLLHQRLITLHLNDTRPDALLDEDLRRLGFVNNQSTADNKKDLYMDALARITTRWGQEPAASKAWYLQANQHYNNARNYDPLMDTTGRFEYVKAMEICKMVTAQKDSSEGKILCLNLITQIKATTIDLQIEKINMPGQPLRALLTWRNFPRLYGRIVRVDRTSWALLNDLYNEDGWDKLLKLPVQRTFEQRLPETGDYQTHRTEIKIDSLPQGEYVLVASADSVFLPGRHFISAIHFHVSAISYVERGRDYFVLQREEGQPLVHADVQIWNWGYDNPSKKYLFSRNDSYRTDEHGHFRVRQVAKNTPRTSTAVEITSGSDHLFIDHSNDVYFPTQFNTPVDRTQYEKDHLAAFLFTDRSIYRPGQMVYFKGIVITRDFDTHKAKIIPSWKTTVFLYDANRTKVDSLELTTDDYGSYHGSFRLPSNLLNGEFRVVDFAAQREQGFSVEEYKRPLFYVSYETLKGSYRVGDTIRVKGSATAYAGNVIDGATVSYTVNRAARYPCFDCWPIQTFRSPFMSQPQVVAHGTAKTDAHGKFIIVFPATPDKSIPFSQDPIFVYNVSATVTDINGESRSANTRVQAGYKTLELSIEQPSDKDIATDSLHSLTVSASNLSGTPEPALVNLSIYGLKAPTRLIRERKWIQPDMFIMSKEEYLRNFPHDDYNDELNIQKWERTGKVYEQKDTAGRTMMLPAGKTLAPGWYVVEASAKDKYGQEVKTIRYIHLYDARTGDPGYPQYNWALQSKTTVQPGEKVTVNIGSSAANVFVIRNVATLSTSADSADFSYLMPEKNKQLSATFPVSESDRGGFNVVDEWVKDGRLYTRQYVVSVPWTNKELSIYYDTYRDKLLPGSEEKWKITISGDKRDKVAAEVLAGMYDASLDQFRNHSWIAPDLYPVMSEYFYPGGTVCFGIENSQRSISERGSKYFPLYKQYDRLITSIDYYSNGIKYGEELMDEDGNIIRLPQILAKSAAPSMRNDALDKRNLVRGRVNGEVAAGIGGFQYDMNPDVRWNDAKDSSRSSANAPSAGNTSSPEQVQVRKNFNETAFFFPDLHTDDSGNVSFSFTMPEALTTWKGMILAHTKDLAFGYSEKSIVTQKQLMVQPNISRFLREGDRMELGVKIVNLSDSEMTGQIELQLIDPTTGETADGIFSNRQANQYFTVAAGQSTVAGFPIDVPYQYNRPLTYRIIARSKVYSDGEEAALPVVSNRMLVTESLPLNMPGDGTKEFHFDKLLHSNNSETLNHHALTVEFTTNPAWYAVQALPYLMEFPYECAEQTFNRFYANALATSIVNSTPRIKAVFEKWKTTDTVALLSNLEKNQELKSILLQETPWVLEGKSESQQKQHIAMLFDMVRMSRELESTFTKFQQMQLPDGGFTWFKGGGDDRYITQYILTGIARLQKMNAIPASLQDKVQSIVKSGLRYLDAEIKKDYADILRQEKNKKPVASGKMAPIWIGQLPIEYLYMRSFFDKYGIPGDVLPAVSYFRKQAQQKWTQYDKYMQGMISLALFRTGDVQTAKNIIASLKETAIRDEERGMYWKGMEGGYFWWQAPIEIQSLLIEAFHEIAHDNDENAMKTWLLRQKQTHNWSTTKATADACYALLGTGNWLSIERDVNIRLGNKTFSSGEAAEAGTGYFKQVVDGARVQPSMGNITVTMKTTAPATAAGPSSPAVSTSPTGPSSPAVPTSPTGPSALPAWGAIYWQYFEDLDKITAADKTKAPLRLVKKLYIEKNTDRGPVLEPVAENGVLHPGDKVKVRIELYADRNLEYVHMKDMRAACMEPINVISQYKWQGGLGYYESTKDASTDFFFSYLPKGSFVFEYPLFVGQKGNFSNGVTSIECMYAPEFAFHSEGIRVNVEEVTP